MPHYVDIHVGKRIRSSRWMASMTQKQLADLVGVKFQQIQKYEIGANRVSASRLYEIAKALNVNVSFFFDILEAPDSDQATTVESLDDADAVSLDLFLSKEATEFLKCYYHWPEEQRRRLFELTRSMSQHAA